MATNTTKLGLIKPDYVDVVDIADLNSNADDIDAAVGFVICTSTTRPSTPWSGQSIFETDTGSSFVWDGAAWQPAGGGGSIEISATAPSSPQDGDLWWDSDNGNLYIYYDDGTSLQWVAANGPQVFVGTAAPAGYQGQLWFDSTQGKTYIYYDDGTSAQWVSAIGGSLSGNVIQVVSTTKTDTFTTTSSTYTTLTGLSVAITPKFASSYLLVTVTVNGVVNDTSGAGNGVIRLYDGTNYSPVGSSVGSRIASTSTFLRIPLPTNAITTSHLQWFYTPNTTSALTITTEVARNGTAGTLYVNRSVDDTDNSSFNRTVSTITVMEIAG